jgi:hypothetical protein
MCTTMPYTGKKNLHNDHGQRLTQGGLAGSSALTAQLMSPTCKEWPPDAVHCKHGRPKVREQGVQPSPAVLVQAPLLC